MPNFEENARILDRIREVKGWKVHGAGAKLAELFGVTESVISNWKTRTDIDLALVRRKLTAEEFAYATGSKLEEPETAKDRHPNYTFKTGPVPGGITQILPEHVQEAFEITLTAIEAAGKDVLKLDRRRTGLVVGLIAEEVAKGNREETRQMLLRRAETLLALQG